MALADMIKDLEKKTAEAKTRIAGGIAFLNDPAKVRGAGLDDKKKMNGFVNHINEAFGRAKEARDKILQSKDYKAISNAKDANKAAFTAANAIVTKELQAAMKKLRDTAANVDAAAAKAGAAEAAAAAKAVAAQKAALAKCDTIAGWSAAMTDKVLGPKILSYCKTTFAQEIIKFLSMMKQNKKDQNCYNLFIKEGAKSQVNISSALRNQFDGIAAAEKPQWGKAPWEAATAEMLGLFRTNILVKVKAG
jgi:hypothetical protein